MKVFVLLLLVACAYSATLEIECKANTLEVFLEAMNDIQKPASISQEVIDSIKNTKEDMEIWDNYVNYNCDFLDRVGEDLPENKIYKDAEYSDNVPKVAFDTKIVVRPIEGKEEKMADIKFTVLGACCYDFNPCIAITMGYHSRVIGTYVSEENKSDLVEAFKFAVKDALTETIKLKKAATETLPSA